MTQQNTRTCKECRTPLSTGRKAGTEFCGTPCRIAWRNRRSSRGAELYDLMMNHRLRRAEAREYGLMTIAYRLIQRWNEEDVAAGRQSFFSAEECRERLLPYTCMRQRI